MKPEAKKLRILHVGNHTYPCTGGIENVIWETAREQARVGHHVTVMVFNTCTNGSVLLPAREEKEGVTILRVSQSGFSFYRIPPEKELLERARDQDIVHIHGIGAWMDILARHKSTLRGKLILTTHGGFFHTKSRGLLKWIYAHLFLPHSWNKMDGVIFVGESDRQHLSFLSHPNTRVIPNGISSELLKLPLAKKKDHTFLFVGRLSRNKRVERLLDAFARYLKHHPAALLHVAGEDWEGLRGGLEARARELGIGSAVTFWGKVTLEQLEKLYIQSDVFVSASEYEGFGISALEAMAAGCIPCLNTIPSFVEFTRQGRGFAVDYADSNQAVQGWEKIARLSAAEKRTCAHAFVLRYTLRVDGSGEGPTGMVYGTRRKKND